jgi:hypothetical protein
MNVTRQIVAVLLAAAAFAIMSLPGALPEPRYDRVSSIEESVRTATTYYAIRSEMLRRAHSRELARAATVSAPRSTDPVTFVRPADVPIGFERRMRAIADREIPAYTRRDTSMRVIVALALDTGSTIAGTQVLKSTGNWSRDAFLPGAVADNACVIVARATRAAMLTEPGNPARWSTWEQLTEPCSWHARYGKPGRGVAAWLDSTYAIAIATRVPVPLGSDGGATVSYFVRGSSAATMACIAGRLEHCEGLMLERPYSGFGLAHIPDAALTISGGRSYSGAARAFAYTLPASLLQNLEHELGETRFREFWKSDEPVPVAFERVTGQPLDRWIRKVLRRDGANYIAGPMPQRRVSLAAVVLLPALLALGIAGVTRRGTFV